MKKLQANSRYRKLRKEKRQRNCKSIQIDESFQSLLKARSQFNLNKISKALFFYFLLDIFQTLVSGYNKTSIESAYSSFVFLRISKGHSNKYCGWNKIKRLIGIDHVLPARIEGFYLGSFFFRFLLHVWGWEVCFFSVRGRNTSPVDIRAWVFLRLYDVKARYSLSHVLFYDMFPGGKLRGKSLYRTLISRYYHPLISDIHARDRNNLLYTSFDADLIQLERLYVEFPLPTV